MLTQTWRPFGKGVMRYIQQHHQIILNAKEFEAVRFKAQYGTNFVTLLQIAIVL